MHCRAAGGLKCPTNSAICSCTLKRLGLGVLVEQGWWENGRKACVDFLFCAEKATFTVCESSHCNNVRTKYPSLWTKLRRGKSDVKIES